ncbi:hypothetical protein [Marivirga sp.]|uniref:hypothetical protein n=1 Tax=Marivirga sp. TaxID=2018662 RepID=UPI0025E8B366|nr:hypothetical protein [Marivirga sp.]
MINKVQYSLIGVILSIFILSCNNDEVLKSCTDNKLEEYNLVPYNGQELDCNVILELYLYKNQQYFQLYNPCEYILTYPFDCENNVVCGKENQMSCNTFFDQAEYIGVIGYRERP